MKIVLIILSIATLAFSQVSPEEAQRRLDERRAQAATRPVDTSIIPDLKFQIATLQNEIARLKAENAALSKRLADAEAAAAATTTRPVHDAQPIASDQPAAPATVPARATGKLRLGMTLEEANGAMGFAAKLVGEGRGWQQYEWQLPGKPRPNAPADDDRGPRSLLGSSGGGTSGPSVFARFENGALTSYAKR